jgi:hypothetical protein
VEIPHDETYDAGDVGSRHPVEQANDVADGRSTLALISDARQALAEARTLPDIRRVMEAASVAADAGRRAAKLAEAQGLAADVVRDAEAAANDAAAVRIEAQAKAGELLREMGERGERAARGRPEKRSHTATFSEDPAGSASANHDEGQPQAARPSLASLGVSKSESSRWQRIASVPPEVRAGYVEEMKTAGDEISTDGLLKHAEQAAPQRLAADLAPPETYRYRLALARTAEQASRIAQFDPEEAAQLVDENSAVVLKSAARTWESWVARFLRARGQLHVIEGGR